MSQQDYNSSAASNTQLIVADGTQIPLGENQTLPRHVNDAFRAIMADTATAAKFSGLPHSRSISLTAKIVSDSGSAGSFPAVGGQKLELDGAVNPALVLAGTTAAPHTYTISTADNSVTAHLRFYEDTTQTTEYTTGVTISGSPGTTGASTQITVSDSTPKVLYYQVAGTPGLGGIAYVLGVGGSGGGSSYGDADVDTHLNRSTAQTNEVLSWNGSDYAWVSNSGGSSYGDADVNTHLNQSTAQTNEVLSWTGSDYDWVAQTAAFTTADVDSHLNQNNPTSGYVLSWNGSDYAWVSNSGGGGGGTYDDSSVNAHLNQSTAQTNEVLSWDGSDYDWVAQTTAYTDSSVNAHLNQSTAQTNEVLSWDGGDYAWVAQTTAYTDSSVDSHLNQSNPTSGYVLSWNGSDYAWVAQTTAAALGYTQAAGEGTVTNTAGTDATLPAATTVYAGLMTAADKTKLDGVEDNADATDAANVGAAGAPIIADATNRGYVEGINQALTTGSDVGFNKITTSSTGSIVPFYWSGVSAFPSAATYHGAIAHGHAEGAMYFAHGGSWVKLAAGQDVASTDNVTFASATINGDIAVSGTVDGVDIAGLNTTVSAKISAANLGFTTTATTGAVTNDAGTDASLSAATTSAAGLMIAADKSKLDAINQTLATTSSPTFANLDVTTELRVSTIDPDPDGNTGTLRILGNLQVDGDTTTINSTNLTVDDLNITVASGAANAAAANGAGITVDGANATLQYASSTNRWEFDRALNVAGNITLSGTVDGVDIDALNTTVNGKQATLSNISDIALNTLTTQVGGSPIDVRRAKVETPTTSADLAGGARLYSVATTGITLTMDDTALAAGDIITIYANGYDVTIAQDATNGFDTVKLDGTTAAHSGNITVANGSVATISVISTTSGSSFAVVAGQGLS